MLPDAAENRHQLSEVHCRAEPQDLRVKSGMCALLQAHGLRCRGLRRPVLPCLQVLANILANAVKFTPSGEVVIHASCKPAMLEGAPGESTGKQLVRVSIRDTGIGISEESMKKLFQCFRQGSESMSRRYGGTGGSSPQCTCTALHNSVRMAGLCSL